MQRVFPWLTSTVLCIALSALGLRFTEILDKSFPPQSYPVLLSTPMNVNAISFMLAIRVFWIIKTGRLTGDFNQRNKVIWSTIFFALITYLLLSNFLYVLPVIPPYVKGVLDCGVGITIGFCAWRFIQRNDFGDD